MGENVTKLPISREMVPEPALQAWQPLESFRREIDRLFDDFGRSFWQPSRWPLLATESLLGREMTWSKAPVVDVIESEKAYEITAEMPGMDQKNIEVNVTNGNLTIKGEKLEEKEEKKDYYLQERKFGSFERSFRVPEGVDMDKIEAAFKNGVLNVTLPKKLEAQKPTKNIEVKTAA